MVRSKVQGPELLGTKQGPKRATNQNKGQGPMKGPQSDGPWKGLYIHLGEENVPPGGV